MSHVPTLTVLGKVGSRPDPPSAWAFESVGVVEIVAPDRECATLLLGHAAGSFDAEIVPGSTWIVRFTRPAAVDDWVVTLLELVERWLHSAPLPCAKMVHDGRDYLIRAPNDVPRVTTAAL